MSSAQQSVESMQTISLGWRFLQGLALRTLITRPVRFFTPSFSYQVSIMPSGAFSRPFRIGAMPSYCPLHCIASGQIQCRNPGPALELSEAIMALLHFDYVYVMPEDRNWGVKINGSFNGILGDLQKNRVDMAFPYFATTSERMEVFPFIPSEVLPLRWMFIFNRAVLRRVTVFRWWKLFDVVLWATFLLASFGSNTVRAPPLGLGLVLALFQQLFGIFLLFKLILHVDVPFSSISGAARAILRGSMHFYGDGNSGVRTTVDELVPFGPLKAAIRDSGTDWLENGQQVKNKLRSDILGFVLGGEDYCKVYDEAGLDVVCAYVEGEFSLMSYYTAYFSPVIPKDVIEEVSSAVTLLKEAGVQHLIVRRYFKLKPWLMPSDDVESIASIALPNLSTTLLGLIVFWAALIVCLGLEILSCRWKFTWHP